MKLPGNICVFASGSGTNLQSLIDSAKESNSIYRVSLVISDQKKAYALSRAEKSNIPNYYLRYKKNNADNFEKEALELLKKYGINLIVLAGFLKFIPEGILSAYQNRIINIHPALLPSFGGAGMYGLYVHQSAIDYGVKVTGVTVHLVNDKYDAGPIIAQIPVLTRWDDTPDILSKRVLEQEHRILPQVVKAFFLGLIEIRDRNVCLKGPAEGLDIKYFGMC